MKNAIYLFLALILLGCSYEGKTFKSYLEEPKYLIQDPHFAGYQEERDALESRYLQKKITYAEYQEELKSLDNKYDQEVQERNAIATHQ